MTLRARHPYEWRTKLRRWLPWLLIDLGIAAKSEDCEAVGAAHLWYNQDGEPSGCYHCNVVRLGQLWRQAESDSEPNS